MLKGTSKRTMLKGARVGIWFLSVAVGVSVAFVAGVGAAKAAGQDGEFKYFAGLLDKEPAIIKATRKHAVKERWERIDELMRIIQLDDVDEPRGGAIETAMSLLAIYRAPEATPVLVKRLLYMSERTRQFRRNMHPPRQLHYPAVQALITIRHEQTPNLLLPIITGSDDPLERELAAFVISKLTDEAQAIALLSKARQESDGAGKAKFDEAISLVKKFNEPRRPPRLKTQPEEPTQPLQP